MTIVEMLGQSGVLTLLGMGIVFGFLVILVVCVSIMGKIIRVFGADKGSDAPASGTPASASGAAQSPVKTTIVAAAISAAVNEYRKNNS